MRTFYIGLKDRLLIIKETEDGYELLTHLEKMKVKRLAIDPQNEKRIYVATNRGLWKSEDGGKSFKQSNTGLTSTNITAVAVNPLRQTDGRNTVYVGTEPSMVFHSEDYGETWVENKGIQDLPSKSSWAFPPRPSTHFVRWITPSETDANYVAVSIEAGAVIYTTDHGKTWQDRAEISPIDVHTLLKHPDAPARLYVANGGMVSNKKRESYAESPDGGYSWDFLSEGLEKHPYLYNLVLHPNDPDYRLASASESASKAHRDPAYSTVYQKAGDEPWEEMADGLPSQGAFTHHLANDPDDVDAFYALNNYGIYYLSAEDTTWEKLEVPWPNEMVKMRPYFFVVR